MDENEGRDEAAGAGGDKPPRGLARRDYREFVRFGKRDFEPVMASDNRVMKEEKDSAKSSSKQQKKRRDDFLR